MNFKKTLPFILISGFVFIVFYLLENINQRFWLNDFRVYYSAASAFIKGENFYQQVYGEDTGLYKYAPSILILFIPFALLPFHFACSVYFFFNSAIIIFTILMCLKIVLKMTEEVKIKKPSLILSLIFICCLNHLIRELHLGNVNMLVLGLIIGAMFSTLNDKNSLAGILLGISILFKPYLLLILVPFLLHRRIKILMFILLTLLFSYILLASIKGINRAMDLHTAWYEAVKYHNETLTSFHTIISILNTNLSFNIPNFFQFILALIIVSLYSILFFLYSKKIIGHPKETMILIMSSFVLLSFIPNLLITDTEHFLFSYSKIILKEEIRQSDLLEDPFFASYMKHAFPLILNKKYGDFRSNAGDICILKEAARQIVTI